MRYKSYKTPTIIKNKYLLFLASIFLVTYGSLAFFYRNIPPNGDEVHYLVGAVSLIKDHDLWLENNYKNKDYEDFGALKFNDHLTYVGRDRHEYPIHGIFYPFLIAPTYSLGGKAFVLIFNAIIAILLMGEIFLVTKAITSSQKLSFWITLAVGLSLPLVHFSVLIFTEIFGAILILELFRRTLIRDPHYLITVLITTFLPWINVRFLPISTAFLLLWFIKNIKFKYRYIWGLIPIISAVSYFLFLKITSGTFNPAEPFEQLNVSTTSGNILGNVINHLIDRQYGLLTYSPIFILAIPGIYFWFKEKKKSSILVAFLSAIYIVPLLRFSDWQGGFTPPARYLVAIIPLWVPSIVFFLKKVKAFPLYIIAGVLSVWGFFAFLVNLLETSSHGFIFIDGVSPFLWHLYRVTGFNVHNLFPAYYPKWGFTWLHLFWTALILITIYLMFRTRRATEK